MFKCGDKCAGVLAAEARLTREKYCFQNAKKDNDVAGMKRTTQLIKNTTDYIKFMEEWPPAVNLAIGPAILIYRIRSHEKRAFIMKQVERAQETGINPMNGKPLSVAQVTGPVIQYLIARYDKVPFSPYKWVHVTPERVKIIKSLLRKCGDDNQAASFLLSLMATA